MSFEVPHHRGAHIPTSEFEDALDYSLAAAGDAFRNASNEQPRVLSGEVDDILVVMGKGGGENRQGGGNTDPPIESVDAKLQSEVRSQEIYNGLLPQVDQIMASKGRRSEAAKMTTHIVEAWEASNDPPDMYERVVSDPLTWERWRKTHISNKANKLLKDEAEAKQKRAAERERAREAKWQKEQNEAARKRKREEDDAAREQAQAAREQAQAARKRKQEEDDAARKRKQEEDDAEKELVCQARANEEQAKQELVREAREEGYNLMKPAATFFIKNSLFFKEHQVTIVQCAPDGDEKKIRLDDVKRMKKFIESDSSYQMENGIMYHCQHNID